MAKRYKNCPPQHWLKGDSIHSKPPINHPWRGIRTKEQKKIWLLRRLRGLEERLGI